jgi:hypothetical protein
LHVEGFHNKPEQVYEKDCDKNAEGSRPPDDPVQLEHNESYNENIKNIKN